MTKIKDWDALKKLAKAMIIKKDLDKEYSTRLKFEFKEIEKQGANRYWVDLFNHREKFDHNKNGLVLPFLLMLTKIDPIKTKWSMIVDEDGPETTEIVVLTLENGKTVSVPMDSIVRLKRGFIKGREIRVGDEVV